MVQELTQTRKTEFNKGLLTEFSELNFPDNASIDELNCELFKAGNRSKRKGIKYEDNAELSDETYVEGTLFHTDTWSNVGQDASLEYLVVQVGSKLRFYRKGISPLSSAIVPISNSNSNPFILDLTSYSYSGGLGAGSSKVELTSINGVLVVVSPQINAVYVERNVDNGSFLVKQISFKIRDLGFYGDPTKRFDAIPRADITPGRLYDTYNAGWIEPFLFIYRDGNGFNAAQNAYPPLTHPWYSGKTSAGDYSTGEFNKIFSGTSLTSVGHFIIDLFNPDRDTVSGVTGVKFFDGTDIQNPRGRFSTVEAYAGRAWFAGVDSRVYYSKILEDPNLIGDFYSYNDPTAEYSSDILETDGGYIRIPEANGIKKLHAFGSSLLVFANNGVWRISGIDGNLFSASSFSIYKITDFGLAARSSLVAGQNSVPFWWSYSGIHTIQVTDAGGMVEVNLSRDTIQTFWNDIGGPSRAATTGVYDALNNTVLWLYSDENETEYKYNNIFFLDVDLGAFYPWKISDKEGDTPYICGTSFFNGSGNEVTTFTVVDSNGNFVVDSSGNNITVERDAGTSRSSFIYFLTRDPSGSLTFSLFDDTSYYDWGEVDYEAFAESAYNFVGDLSRRKNSPWITAYMRQTESGFEEVGGQYYPLEESSLKVTAYWDFKKNSSSLPQEIYRHKLPTTFTELESFPSPTTVLSTRLKLRGRGKVVRLRFEGQPGKAFNLLGWETIDARNQTL